MGSDYVVTLLVECQVQVNAPDENAAIDLARQSFGYDDNTVASLPQVIDVREGVL